jgi:hypothetical protein
MLYRSCRFGGYVLTIEISKFSKEQPVRGGTQACLINHILQLSTVCLVGIHLFQAAQAYKLETGIEKFNSGTKIWVRLLYQCIIS